MDLSELIDGLNPGPTAARNLLAYLEAEPDALTSGKSDGPPIRLRLLEQFAARLPGVVELPSCVSCGRQVPLFRKLGRPLLLDLLGLDQDRGVRTVRRGPQCREARTRRGSSLRPLRPTRQDPMGALHRLRPGEAGRRSHPQRSAMPEVPPARALHLRPLWSQRASTRHLGRGTDLRRLLSPHTHHHLRLMR
jgi:hypothetical protein